MATNKYIIPVIILISVLLQSCNPPVKMKVLIRMMDNQKKYFKDDIVSFFKLPEETEIEVIDYNSMDSIDFEQEKYPGQILLVKIPFEKGWSLVKKDKILPLNSFLSVEELQEINDTYLFTFLGRHYNTQYFIPRKYETRIMVYLKSKVTEALGVWKVYSDSIDHDLKRLNGFGLPKSYSLERDPNSWDYYDIFVIGWIWSHRKYNGTISPRIAHRGKRYLGTSHRLVDRIYQCNGDDAAVTSMQGDPVIDVFHWEAVYQAAGIYNQKMIKDKWAGSDIWKGFSEGEIFLSFMTQLDCFFLHGTGSDSLLGFLENPDDMGVATMPSGCSFELSGNGTVLRKGRKMTTTGGWWWGIPKDSPDPKLSYNLARHITDKYNQTQGCRRFGMIPVRKDIREELDSLFEEKWVRSVFDASYRQLVYNKSTVIPSHTRFYTISNLYLDAWFDIVVDRNWSERRDVPDRFYIKQILDIKYIPIAKRFNKS